MRVALLVAAKDLRQRLRDRSAVILAVIAPLALATIISTAFGNFDQGFSIRVAVADEDGGQVAGGLTGLLVSPQLADLVRLRIEPSAAAARAAAANDDADAAVIIPSGFSAQVVAGQPAQLTVVRNAEQPIEADVAAAIVDGFAAEVRAAQLAARTAVALGAANLDLAEVAGLRIPLQLADRPVGRDELDPISYFAPAMGILFLFFTVGIGARSVLAERSQGTLARLAAAPVSPRAVLAGKALATFVLGLASLLVLWAITVVGFGATWGDPAAVVALCVAAVVAAMGITSLLTTLATTDQQAEQYSTVVSFMLALLGGNFIDVDQLPGTLKAISRLTPNGWALRAFRDLSADGAGLPDVITPLAVVLAFGAVTGGIAATRARRVTVQ